MDEIRTNNEIECWNGQIYRKGGERKLHIYLLWSLLYDEATGTFERFLYESSDYTKKRQREINQAVKAAYDLYSDNLLNPMGLLDKLVRATSKIVVNIPVGYDPTAADSDTDDDSDEDVDDPDVL